MTDWNKILKDSIGTPEVPGGVGRKKNKIVRTPPSIEKAMAGIHTTYNSQRKATAPYRVMAKAIEYHRQESSRRQARYIKPDRANLKNFISLVLAIGTIVLCIMMITTLAGI